MYPVFKFLTSCPSCGKKIFFAITKMGRVIPIDCNPCENGNIDIDCTEEDFDFAVYREGGKFSSHFHECQPSFISWVKNG